MQKGFATIIFIIIILLASGGIVGGSYLIKNNFKNTPTNNVSNTGNSIKTETNSKHTSERIDFDDSCLPQDIDKDRGVCINTDGQVYLLELPSLKKVQITNVTSRKLNPQIDGDYITWLDEREQLIAGSQTGYGAQGPVKQDRIGQDIYLYNLKTKEEKKITTKPALRTNLQLNENHMAWIEQTGYFAISKSNYYDNEIHTYDISSAKEPFSSTIASTKQGLRLRKDKLVWADSRNGKNTGCENCADNKFDIYLYDFVTGQEKSLVEGPYLKTDPDIEGNNLVWADYRNKKSDIYLMDITNHQEKQITTSDDSEVRTRIENGRVYWVVRWPCDVGIPSIKIASGSDAQRKVAISPIGNTSNGIYVYNLSTQEKKKLTDYVEASFTVSDNLVVIGEGCHGSKPKVYGIYVD